VIAVGKTQNLLLSKRGLTSLWLLVDGVRLDLGDANVNPMMQYAVEDLLGTLIG
jgi:hypothetical protein